VSGLAGDIAGAAARSLIEGSDFGDNIIAGLPGAIGATIGQIIADGVQRSGRSGGRALTRSQAAAAQAAFAQGGEAGGEAGISITTSAGFAEARARFVQQATAGAYTDADGAPHATNAAEARAVAQAATTGLKGKAFERRFAQDVAAAERQNEQANAANPTKSGALLDDHVINGTTYKIKYAKNGSGVLLAELYADRSDAKLLARHLAGDPDNGTARWTLEAAVDQIFADATRLGASGYDAARVLANRYNELRNDKTTQGINFGKAADILFSKLPPSVEFDKIDMAAYRRMEVALIEQQVDNQTFSDITSFSKIPYYVATAVNPIAAALDVGYDAYKNGISWNTALNLATLGKAKSLRSLGGSVAAERGVVDLAGGSRALQTYWPPNRGFQGAPIAEKLGVGTRIDRYGYEGGTFLSPEGTPTWMRSLAPGTTAKPYNIYEVTRPIEVQSGRAAPWFGQVGQGTQYELPMSVTDAIAKGHIKRVGP
jgi:Tuberculosis necrotizing toxin